MKPRQQSKHLPHVAREDGFVGRKAVLRQLLNGCSRGESLFLLGGPRIGITSVLKVFQQNVKEGWHTSSPFGRVWPVYVDVESLPLDKPALCASALWDTIRESLLDRHLQADTPPPVLPRKYVFPRQTDPLETLAAHAEHLSRELKGFGGWFRYAVCLDHAEGLFVRRAHPYVKAFLAWCGSKRLGAPSGWVFAGGQPLWNIMHEGAEVFRSMPHVLMGVLDEDESMGWLRAQNTGFSEEDIQTFFGWTGHHPYLNRKFLELRTHPATKGLPWESCADHLIRDESVFFERVQAEVLGGGYKERALPALKHMMRVGHEMDVLELERALGVGLLRDVLDVFEGSGVVVKRAVGGAVSWKVAGGLWKRWGRQLHM